MGVGQHALASPLIRGVWTWARGGGWQGPYILGGGNGAEGSNGGGAAGEFWEGINVFVVSQWMAARLRASAPQPPPDEQALFHRYCAEELGLNRSVAGSAGVSRA